MAMNCYLNGAGIWQNTHYVSYKRFTEIRNPSATWVFIDEREDSINDGYFAIDMDARYAVIDYPASYHNGSGTLSFADGHVESHRWVEATTSPPLRRGYHLPGGPKRLLLQDRDMQWLTERTTVKENESALQPFLRMAPRCDIRRASPSPGVADEVSAKDGRLLGRGEGGPTSRIQFQLFESPYHRTNTVVLGFHLPLLRLSSKTHERL